MQAALQAVKGVKEAKVSQSDNEATVKYDSAVAKVDDLVKAVKESRGMNRFDAKEKKK